jgi:hypothetical protein
MSYHYGTASSLQSIRGTDTDGDGFDAETEYAYGTDPKAANDAVSAHSRLPGGALRLHWNALTNQTYVVQSSTNLHGIWTNRPAVPVVTDGSIFGTNGIFYQPMRADVTNGAAAEFFRIHTEFTPSQLE